MLSAGKIGWIAVATAAAGAVAVLGVGETPNRKLVAEFEGKGAAETAAFTVADDWQIVWTSRDNASSSGRVIGIWDTTLPRTDLKNPRYLITHGKQDFTTDVSNGGQYRLRISYGRSDHRGLWKVQIYQRNGRLD